LSTNLIINDEIGKKNSWSKKLTEAKKKKKKEHQRGKENKGKGEIEKESILKNYLKQKKSKEWGLTLINKILKENAIENKRKFDKKIKIKNEGQSKEK
jgi:hypothetical protein